MPGSPGDLHATNAICTAKGREVILAALPKEGY